jgi:hypothetical protein
MTTKIFCGILAGLSLAPVWPAAAADDQPTSACPIKMLQSPAIGGEGIVVLLMDNQAAMAALARTEETVGAHIDPAYLNNQRAVVQMPDGRRTVVALPPDMALTVGDHVTFQGNYRSPNLPCSYVPNVATRKLSSP